MSFCSSSSEIALGAVRLAELLLDRLQLLAQVILALRLVHLSLHLGVDLVGELQDLELAVQELEHVLETLRDLDQVEDLHLLFDGDVHVGGDQVGEVAGIVDAFHELRGARRDLGHEADDLARRLLHVHHQRLDLERIGVDVLHLHHTGAQVRMLLRQTQDPEALDALEDQMEALLAGLQRLHDATRRAHRIQIFCARIVHRSVLLGHDPDGLARLLHGLHHGERLGPTHRDRHDAAREEDRVPQRQNRDVDPLALTLSELALGHLFVSSVRSQQTDPRAPSRHIARA